MLKMLNRDTNERVVITGMGIVCPVGHDVESLWQALLTGKSGAAKTTIFDASTFPTTFGAEVKDYHLPEHTANPQLHEHSNRGSGFVIGATAQACKQAAIDIETDQPADGIDRTRLGIYLGAGIVIHGIHDPKVPDESIETAPRPTARGRAQQTAVRPG